jgi:hypothetical protein
MCVSSVAGGRLCWITTSERAVSDGNFQLFCTTGSGLWCKLSEACAYVCPWIFIRKRLYALLVVECFSCKGVFEHQENGIGECFVSSVVVSTVLYTRWCVLWGVARQGRLAWIVSSLPPISDFAFRKLVSRYADFDLCLIFQKLYIYIIFVPVCCLVVQSTTRQHTDSYTGHTYK